MRLNGFCLAVNIKTTRKQVRLKQDQLKQPESKAAKYISCKCSKNDILNVMYTGKDSCYGYCQCNKCHNNAGQWADIKTGSCYN